MQNLGGLAAPLHTTVVGSTPQELRLHGSWAIVRAGTVEGAPGRRAGPWHGHPCRYYAGRLG
eukprot:4023145-Pyramimonas_sp.AAC.2